MPEPQTPAIGADVTDRMPKVGEDVTALMGQPAPADSTQGRGVVGSIGHGLADFWEQVNPVTAIQSIVAAAKEPRAAAEALWKAHNDLWHSADEDLKNATPTNGKYVDAAVKRLNAVIPLFGLAMQAQAEKGAKGDWAGLIGGSAGIGANLKLPDLLKGAPSSLKVPGVGAGTAAERAAVDFASARGIPVDAATATGNQFVRGVQYLSDRTLPGSVIAQSATKGRESGLAKALEDVSNTVRPTATSTEQAGDAIRGGLQRGIATEHTTANAAYDVLRQIEAKRPIAVDYSDLKRALQPIRDRMYRQLPVTVRQNSPGFQALEQVLSGPDRVPLSIADSDLSVLKGMAREADPYLRSSGQGIAAKTSTLMDKAIMDAAGKAGPDALQALQKGRAATRAKYEIADVLGQFADEPVRAFNQAVLAKDAGMGRLMALRAKNPQALPAIGRAYLDDLAAKATAEGGFGRTAGLWADWQRLGPATKSLLFPAQTVKDLDSLFLFAKRAAESPNPSGTGHIVSLLGQGELLLHSPVVGGALQISGAAVSKLLRSPAGVKALRDGFMLPALSGPARKAAQVIADAQAQTIGHSLVPALTPVTAQDQPGMTQ